MLPVTIRTTDPATGAELNPPPSAVRAAHEASEWVGELLGPVADSFRVRADWQFTRPTPDRVAAEFVLTADPDVFIRQDVPGDRFSDPVAVRQSLHPALTTLGRVLMRVSGERIKQSSGALMRSLDAYFAAEA